MDQRLYIAGITAAVAVTVVSAFYVGNRLSRLPESTRQVPSEQLVAEARKSIPPLIIPPNPAPHQETTVLTQQVAVVVPVTTCKQVSVFFGSVCMPYVHTETHFQAISSPVQKEIAPTQAEELAWQKQIDSAQRAYKAALDKKISELSKQQQEKAYSEAFTAGQAFIRDTIIPLITALTGLLSAIVFLYRGYAPAPARVPQPPNG